jgi:hypothetical protein
MKLRLLALEPNMFLPTICRKREQDFIRRGSRIDASILHSALRPESVVCSDTKDTEEEEQFLYNLPTNDLFPTTNMDDVKSEIRLLLTYLGEDTTLSETQLGAIKEVKDLFETTFQADIVGAFVRITFALRVRIQNVDINYFASQGFLDGIKAQVLKYCKEKNLNSWGKVSEYLMLILKVVQTKAIQNSENASFNFIMKKLTGILVAIEEEAKS